MHGLPVEPREGAARYGFARPAVPFPLYADEPLPEGDESEAACKAEIKRADRRLSTLAGLIEQVLADLAGLQATLRALEADGKPVPASELRRWCVAQAALWQSLAHWFGAGDDDACGEAEQELRGLVTQAAATVAASNGHVPASVQVPGR